MPITKTLTVIFCLTFTFLFAVFSGNCQEAIISWEKTGDAYFSSGNYKDAAIAYERTLFSGQAGNSAPYVKLKKAECYKQTGNFSKSLQVLESIFLPGLTDSLKSGVIYQKALCHYLNHDPENALFWLQQLSDTSASNKLLTLEIFVYTDLYNTNQAETKLNTLIEKNYTGNKKDSLLHIAKSILASKKLHRKKDKRKAALLSTVFPGLGQCYTGYPGRGILALTFTSGSIALGLVEIANGFYFTGYVTGFGFFQKFYFGGIEQSRRLADEKNSKSLKKLHDTIGNFIFSNFKE